MAENINAADVNSEEQSVESTNQAGESSLSQTPKLPSNLPAKPQSIDAYRNTVGNPVTGSNPMGDSNGDHFAFARNQALTASQKSQTRTNDYYKMRPYTYSGDFDGANFDRYYNTSKFESLGFSPYRDNESLYNQKMTLGDDFVRAASQWPGLVKTGFMSGVRSWGTMFTDPLAPDIEGAREMQKYMAIGSSSKGGFGGFLTNTFLNSGYTIGIGADLLMEEIGLAAVTGFTGGLAGEITAPGMAAKLGMATRRLVGFSELAAKSAQVGKRGANVLELSRAAKAENEATKTIKALNGVSDMRNFWNTTMGKVTSKALDVMNPLENTVDFLKAGDYATDYAKVAGTFGAFAKDIIMTKAAVSEAQLEGGMVKIDTSKDLIQAYRDSHNGQDPTGEELQKIENLASQASAKTALWNLPAIMWSNKFMYETMLAPINKMVKSNGSKLIDDIIFDNKSFRAIGDGYLEKTKLAFKALSKPKTYGKYGFDYLKANFAEGIQENLQEAISKGAAEQAMAVYKDPTRADYEGYMGHFMKGLGEQFSAQGAETFAGGFAMGMFAQPVMSAPAWSISKGLDLTVNRERAKAAKEERDRLLKQDVDTLNELYKNDVNFFAPDLQAAVAGNGLSNDLYSAAAKGDEIGARNAKEAASFHHIHTALKTGKYDIFINKLKDYQNFSPKEAKEAFQEYGVEDGNKALKYIGKVIDRAEQIKTNYENVASEFPNPFRPNSYKAGTPLYSAHLTSYHAWEEAKKNLIFAKTSMQSHSERVEQMAQTFSKFGVNVAQSDAQTFMSLLDPSKTANEITTLRKEIAVLDPKNPEQASIITEKKETVKLLNEFYNALAANKFAETDKSLKRSDDRAREKFAKIVEYLGKKNKSFVYNNSTEKAYQLIKDSMQLKDEMQGLTNSINVLSNPTGFLSTQKRLEEVYSKAVRQKADILQFNKRQFITRKEANNAINDLQEVHGLGITPEFAQSLRESLASDTPMPLPTSFVDLATDLPVDESDARFKEALKLWEAKIDFIENKKEEEATGEKKEEVKSSETKKPETKPSTFNKEDYDTYPEDLKKLIQEDFDKRKSGDSPILEDTVEDYALNNIFVQGIITKYFKKKKDIEEGKVTPNEYSKLSKEELKSKIKEFDDKEKLTKEDLDILDKLEDALANNVSESKLTEAQQETLKKIEFLSSKTRKKNDDQSGYNINGTNYNLRVTKLVDRILEKDFGLKQFSFSQKPEGEVMVNLFKDLKENIALKTKDKKKYANNLVDELFKQLSEKPHFKKTLERFNDRKIQGIKEGLKDDTSVENFIKLIEKYVYEESSIRGNTADDIVRAYFNNEEVTKPDGMNQDAFDNLIDILKDIKKGITARNEVIISKSLILSGEYSVEGKDEKVAGEMDLLVIDKDGEFKIYDLKTADNWNYFGTKEDNEGKGWRKKYRYTLQLSLYKKLLEDATGIKVKELELIPIETKEDKNGNITELKSAFDTKNTNIDYNPLVEKYLQPLGTKNEVPVEVEVEKKETKEPEVKPKETPKGKIEAKDFIGRTYNYEEDGEKAIVKVLNITPGNEVLFETTFVETDESFEQTMPFKDFQGSVSSGIFKEIKVEVEEEEEEPTFIPEKDKVIPKKVKGASGWKLRFNINATTDKDYKSKAEKLSKWLDSYFGTSKRQEQKGNGYFAFKEGSSSSVWKHLAGGEKGESDFTIYIGSKKDAIRFAKQVEKSEIKDLITIGTMGEDILIGNIVKGRFDSKEFKYLVPNVNILKKSLEEEGLSKNGEFVTETKSGIKIVVTDGEIIYSTDGGKTFKDYKSGIMSDTKNVLEIRNQIIEDIYGDDYTGKGKPHEGPTPLSADEFNALSVSDKFNTLINTIDDKVVEGVLEPVTLPPGKVRPGKEWGYQLRLADGKTLRITYATRIQGVENIPVGETFTINKEKYTYEKDGQPVTEDILAVKKDGKIVSNIVKNFDIFAEKTKVETPIEKETTTLEQLNKDINKNSLKIAKEKGYEVEYNSLDKPDISGNYIISKITKNSVSLTNPAMGNITVPIESISSTIKAIVEPGKKNFTQEEQDKLKENKEVINKSEISFNDNLNEDQSSSNLIDNLC